RILWDLKDGPLRYGQIKSGLLRGAVGTQEIAPRVLSRELKALAGTGLIGRFGALSGARAAPAVCGVKELARASARQTTSRPARRPEDRSRSFAPLSGVEPAQDDQS